MLKFILAYYSLFGLTALAIMGIGVIIVFFIWFIQVFDSWQEPK